LAPGDPLTHWRLGSVIQTELPPDQISASVGELEKAVSLSPNDYRLWMVLGKAHEQAGEFEKAEQALRKSVKLAPAYAYPRWNLGNLLLRADRYKEAFSELQFASEANGLLQSQLFNLAWQVNKSDFNALKAAIGDTPKARAEFSKYLVGRNRFEDGLRLWDSLSEAEKKANRSSAGSLIADLIDVRHYHQAVKIWNDIAPESAFRAELGRIVDHGFEDNVAHGPGAVFGWQVPDIPQMQVGIDPNMGHTGSRSLRIVFQVRSKLDAFNVVQLVPVLPDTQYDFECYLKTDKLVSGSTPVLVIADAADGTALATSDAAPAGSNEWQRVSLSFKTGIKSEALKLGISRIGCGADSPVCPIFGTVWYDDFDLKSRQ
jgi:tetratricopeptide repeat protein